jgi:hypothetical protein
MFLTADLTGLVTILWGFGVAALCGLLLLLSLIMNVRDGVRSGPHAQGPTPWGRRLIASIVLGVSCAAVPYMLGESIYAKSADAAAVIWGPLLALAVVFAFVRAGGKRPPRS